MKWEWKVGDKLQVLDASKIIGGHRLLDGGIYEVDMIINGYAPRIRVGGGCSIGITRIEFPYVERVTDDEEDTERNAELGEPSADCNCVTLSEIYDEIVDMKAMIGRLIRNGGDEE